MTETLKMMVVDDDPAFRRFMKEVLEGVGDLLMTVDGEDALAAIACYKPHIVLLDVKLPGINGLEVCQRVRLSKAFSGTFIILVSACARIEDIENGFRAGANAYLTKPFYHEHLINLIEQCHQRLSMSQSPGLLFIDRPVIQEKGYKAQTQ